MSTVYVMFVTHGV